MTSVLIPLAGGVEEMEAVIIMDVLRRAQWRVVSAGIEPGHVEGSRGVRILPDAQWAEVAPMDFDAIVIPGGLKGVEKLAGFAPLLEVARIFAETDRILAAICAGPLVLHAAGVLRGKKATCHPSCAAHMAGVEFADERVVRDGNIVTSQGPGTAMEFSLFLIGMIDGPGKAGDVARAMLVETQGG